MEKVGITRPPLREAGRDLVSLLHSRSGGSGLHRDEEVLEVALCAGFYQRLCGGRIGFLHHLGQPVLEPRVHLFS